MCLPQDPLYSSQKHGEEGYHKVITQECGFLDDIERGDAILADRGFNIADDLAIRGAKLENQSFYPRKKSNYHGWK